MVRAYNYNQIMNVTSSLEGINSFLIYILRFGNFLKYDISSSVGSESLILWFDCEVFF